MKHFFLFFLLLLTGTKLVSQIRYASSVQSVSSQYIGSCQWVDKILGAPDAPSNPSGCRYKCNTWAHSTPDGSREFIELVFSGQAHPIERLMLWETSAPGSVDTIYAWNATNNEWVILMQRTAESTPCIDPEPTIFDFPPTEFPVSIVRIAFNSPAVADWNEFDAVAIVNSETLPVTGLFLKGHYDGGNVSLQWNLLTEYDNLGFYIESSLDGFAFSPHSFVSSEGNSTLPKTYYYTNQLSNNSQSVIYYRLKQVDNDGKFTYSNTISVRINQRMSSTIYPNPVKGHLTIRTHKQISGIFLTDISGKILLKQKVLNSNSTINMQHLPNGLYLLQTVYLDGTTENIRVVKE